MNKYKKRVLIAVSGLLLFGSAAQAQQVNVNINTPSWGPSAPTGTQYYYIPEVGGYYDLRDQYYVVERQGKWKRLKSINGYAPSSFHPVVINYRGTQPWVQLGRHQQVYPVSLPPGQVKRLENGKGLPPGQAKKLYGGKGHGQGKGKH